MQRSHIWSLPIDFAPRELTFEQQEVVRRLSHVAQLGALKALWDFRFRDRQHLVVAEALHVAHLETVYEHPVEASEVIGAPFEGKGVVSWK